MKLNKEGDSLFEFTKSLTEMSQMGNLYGRLSELKDQKMHIQIRINELEKQIEEKNPLKKQKGVKMNNEKLNTEKQLELDNLKDKNELIDEIQAICKANKDNKYCCTYQLKDMIEQTFKMWGY